tara:strand:+ start:347 stop:622 length:276 start_codon:yes stop_codon:yes gene_type:complete
VIGQYTKITLVKGSYEADLRGMPNTKTPRLTAFQVPVEDQSTKEVLKAELKHHQGTNKFRMPDLKLIRKELEEWMQGIESKKIAFQREVVL